MTSYEKYLCASAEFEVEQLKNSGQEFSLCKEAFSPTDGKQCFYGQVFGNCISDEAMAFKKDNNIRIGFDDNKLSVNGKLTALEELLSRLWVKGEKEQVYKIVEQFASWKYVSEKDC